MWWFFQVAEVYAVSSDDADDLKSSGGVAAR